MFRRLLTDRRAEEGEIRRAGRELFVNVFQPLETALKNVNSLEIAAESALAGLPFAAFVSTNGTWLGDHYEQIVYSPPLSGALVPHAAAFDSEARVLVAGSGAAANIFGTPLGSPKEIDSEVDLVAGTFPRSHRLLGEAAVPSGVRFALHGTDIFHFSGHVFLTASDAAFVLRPEPGSGERLLWTSSIPVAALEGAKMVVLAGCSTGRGPGESSDPSSGMARAFLLAGVPRVLASRWDVDSAATSILIRSFYAALAKGQLPEQALRSAVATVRKELTHPYYWAAFDMFRA